MFPCTVKRLLCFQLDVGVIVLGWMDIAFSSLKLMLFATLFAYADDHLFYKYLSYRFAEDDYLGNKLIFMVQIGIQILKLVTSILLAIGATQRNRLLLVPYLVVEGIYLTVIVAIALRIALLTFAISLDALYPIFYFVMYSVMLAYLWTSVVSLYYVFRDENNPTLNTQNLRELYTPFQNQYDICPPPYTEK